MKPLYKGVIVTVLQIALVVSMGGKMLYDRATRPRVWVRTANYDPDLPIRGRYVSLRLEATPEGFGDKELQDASRRYGYGTSVRLEAKDGKLIALPAQEDENTGISVLLRTAYVPGKTTIASQGTFIQEPVAFFIPENAQNPTRLNSGEELWVEVTVPRKGLPRPIRLGIKKNGTLTPLNLD